MPPRRNLRVLHIASSMVDAPGVSRQMEHEHHAAHALGLDWETAFFVPEGAVSHSSLTVHLPAQGHTMASRWRHFRRAVARRAIQLATDKDVLLFRYPPNDLNVRLLRRRLPTTRLVSVHHTLEPRELLTLGGLVGRARSVADHLLAGRLMSGWDGVVVVTPEIGSFEAERLGVPSGLVFLYPNGITLGEKPTGASVSGISGDTRSTKPELVFTASSFLPWQGLDRLILEASNCRQDFRLHLVGALSDEQQRMARRDDRVVMHGTLSRRAIDELLARAWIGIAGLAFDRTGMREACPLKVREYLAAGVPVVSGYQDVFPDDFPFYRQTGADLDAILEAAREWRDIDRLTVREAARPHIDKVELVRRLHSELEAVFAEPDA